MTVIISLGSNLGDRLTHLVQAREALAHLPQTRLTASSRVYETEAVGALHAPPGPATRNAQPGALQQDLTPAIQDPKFLNAILILETTLEAHAFSDAAHAIEACLGRTRTADRNAPRVIDIDLICCDRLQLDEPALQLPHPRAHLRRFVCEPLAELRPDLILPGRQLTIRETLAQLPATPAVALASEQW